MKIILYEHAKKMLLAINDVTNKSNLTYNEKVVVHDAIEMIDAALQKIAMDIPDIDVEQ